MLFTEKRERVALVGFGGMGKTQIALELVHRVLNMEVDVMVDRHCPLWMPAQTIEAFHKAATEIVQKIGIECKDNDPKETLRRYLSSKASGHWLLVVDNIDDGGMLDGGSEHTAGLSAFLPQSDQGKVLFTTRLSSVAKDAAGSDVVKLKCLSFDEAYAFMQTSLRDKTQMQDKESIKKLLEKLTYLPLPLAQAAAYVNKTKTPISHYLTLCQSADKNLINLLGRRVRNSTLYTESQKAVATTWTVSFNAIQKSDTEAVRLLTFIQWIDSKSIPIRILPASRSDVGFHDSIGLLCDYGFLSWRDGETLDMHSLVHLVLRTWSEQAGDGVVKADEAVAHLDMIFPSDEWENRAVWRRFLPHVMPLFQDVGLRQDQRVHSLGHKIVLCLRVDGRTREMVEVLEHVVAIQETLDDTHPDRLGSQHALALAYQSNGQVKEAIEALEHVVAIQKETLAETHPGRLNAQYALAVAYCANGQVKEAIEAFEHLVAT